MSITTTPARPMPDPSALITSNLGFVVGVASEFRGRGIVFEDLVAEGNVGLVEAALRFDGARGVKFITYAAWWIRKRILKALAEQSRVVHVSAYRRKLERHHPAEHPAVRLRLVGLDDRPSEELRSIGDQLASSDDGPERALLRDEAIAIAREVLTELPRTERRILELRHGLEEGEELTLKEIGRELSLSRERVRQIEVRAAERFRRALRRRRSRRECVVA